MISMEKIRIKQIEDLIKKASSQQKTEIIKEPEEAVINVKDFEDILKELIMAEDFIYVSSPSHRLPKKKALKFCEHLLKAREKIDKILSDFKVLEKEDLKERIRKLSKKTLIITPKSDIKKFLINKGVESQQIVVVGAQLTIEDMKKTNPNIPEKALKGVEKRIEHVKNDISKKIEHMNVKDILVIAESNLNSKLLGKRAKELYGARVFLHENPRNLEDKKLVEIFST